MPDTPCAPPKAQAYHTWSAWKFDIGAVIMTIGFNAVIIGLLFRFDGQAVPDWVST